MSLPGQRPWLRKRFWAVVVVVIVLGFGVAAWAFSENPYAGGNAITNLVNGFRPLRPTNLLLIGNSALKPSTASILHDLTEPWGRGKAHCDSRLSTDPLEPGKN